MDNSQIVLDFQELMNQIINDVGALPRVLIGFILSYFGSLHLSWQPSILL